MDELNNFNTKCQVLCIVVIFYKFKINLDPNGCINCSNKWSISASSVNCARN